MTIGETIRLYRKQLDLTQAQLAEAVGVSVQAVSKWETGAGMPDVAQIIPLAKALQITTDKLLDFTDRREELEQHWRESLREQGDDPLCQLELAKAALEEFPKDTQFLFRAAWDEWRLALDAEESEAKRFHLCQSLQYTRKLLAEDPEYESAKELQVRVYSELGMNEEAVALACQCRNCERALKSCLKGEELRLHRQKIVDRKLQSLLRELTGGGPEMLDAAERILCAAIPDGNFQHYEDFLTEIYVKRIQGQTHEQAASILSKLLELLGEGEGKESFTTPLFDLLTQRQRPPEIPDGLVMPPHDGTALRKNIADEITWHRSHGE